ncbi:MAG: hypothetical protein JWO60_2062 [Frankiales bacterium]|nr:hypothetical protein [Frankiales bacterium]
MPSLTRVLLLSVGGVVVAGGALLGVATAASGDEVPRGVSVAGVDLGGADRAEAASRVRQALSEVASTPVAVEADDVARELSPVTSGLGVDVDAVVDDAMAGGPLDRVKGLLGTDREVDVRGQVDEQRLRSALTTVKEAVDRAPREGAIRFQEATPVAVPPLTGRKLDLDAAVRTVADGWLGADAPLELAVETTPVKSTAEGVQSVLDGIAKPAVSAPVSVDLGERTLEVRPADIAAALTFPVDEQGELSPSLSGKALRAALGGRADAVERKPVEATVRLRGGKPQVVPSQTGLALDDEKLAAAVQPLLRAPAPRTASLPLVEAQPSLTTAEAEALGVDEVIGTFTTRFPCCAPRVTNIRRIAQIVDDTLVLPGETFSLNGEVGRRTAEKGFVSAPQILDGEFVKDFGGGVSQFATTMFNAVFFSGLQDVEHKPHSYYITRYPEGREATVFFPEVDLKWKNDSGKGVLVTTSTTGTSVTVTFWGTKTYEIEALKGPRTRVRPFEKKYITREDCTPASGHEGFDITVTRVFKQGGREVKRERFFTRYQPEPNFICGPPPGGGST